MLQLFPLVLASVGHSGSGKTTVLEQLIAALSVRGVRVAAIKRARDDFDVDQPGKDSYRLRKAGVERVLVVSQARKALIVEHPAGPPASLTQLLTQLEPGIDLVLVEGYADQPCARVLIHRQGWPLPEPFAQASVLALLSDAQPLPQLGYAPSLALGDIPSLEQMVYTWWQTLSPRASKMSEPIRQASCADDYDPQSLPVSAALQRIQQVIQPLPGRERVGLRSALGRILAEPVISPLDVPAHTNSAMDGYALAGAQLPANGVISLQLIGSAYAGKPFGGSVDSGQCVRIMTGAVMPAGTDTVVMQEHVELQGESVRIGSGYTLGDNVRQAGEDLAQGACALSAGRRLTAADLGLIASLGIGEVWVQRRPRVAFFSTGDELRSIGEPLTAGQIYDSNRYTLYGMLQQLGVELLDMGVVPDDRQALTQAFGEAASCADALITSGGVSVGEADYTKDILAELGQVEFWKIAMKPGRPLAFGRLGGCWFFGLPGNPVSVMVTFYQFVLPALRYLMGLQQPQLPLLRAVCRSRLKKRPGRTEFQRGVVTRDADGQLSVQVTGEQGSGILRSMSEANCFIILPDDCGRVEPGAWVDVQLFTNLM